jgi:hypothetical protein
MSELKIETHENRTTFAPLDTVDGLAMWQLDKPADWVEIRLFWHTQGKGTQDVRVVAQQRWDQPQGADAQVFSLPLPAGPYSYTGTLIHLQWGLELVVEGVKDLARLELTVQPRPQDAAIDLSMPAT